MEGVRGFQCDCGRREFSVYEEAGKYRIVCLEYFDQYIIKSDSEIVKCEEFTDQDADEFNKQLKKRKGTIQ